MPDPEGQLIRAPIHYATGLPMAHCPTCGKLSGLSGVTGDDCLECFGKRTGEDYPADVVDKDREAAP